MTDEPQPQVEVPAEVEQPVEAPQVDETPKEEPPAEVEVKAEVEPPKETTYSQEQWSKRESELRKQSDSYRQKAAQAVLEKEVEKQRLAESQASTQDRKSVEDGLITPEEAQKRQGVRTQLFNAQREIAGLQQVKQAMDSDIEATGRIKASQDFGKQYNLTNEQISEIFTDQEIKSPDQMRAKAADLALENERGKQKVAQKAPPKFDSGQASTGGGNLPLTSKQLIKAGWEEEDRKKK